MGIRSFLSKPVAAIVAKGIRKRAARAPAVQEGVFRYLMHHGRKTVFGGDHHFKDVRTYDEFKNAVSVRDYESLSNYFNRVKNGEPNLLWPGKPIYLSKTSGTTSGVKYIPITRESIPNHIHGARNALLMYINETGKSTFTDKKMIFLSGSPVLEQISGIHTGRLSGIVNHHVPQYLRGNQLPSYATNCIEDWEKKVDAIVDETVHQDMSLISGIPPWVQMYFDKLTQRTGKSVKDIFPDFSLFVYGGVNYEPYRSGIEASIGKRIDSIELYPASEGFIAYQDSQQHEGLLLITDSGIFYEFIPVDEYFNDNRTRLSLRDVQVGVNYAIVLNTNAGLWGYSIGDTVRFTSLHPPRLVVTGRIKHFISAFGEHVIGKEVEEAFLSALRSCGGEATEFTVAPQVAPASGLPYHEWFIEFTRPPQNMAAFAQHLDQAMSAQNIYYKDLIAGHILQPLHISLVARDGFINYMRAQGKLGGQNKLPRLANDRTIANALQPYILKP